jgi:hypothetical protein
MAVCKKCGWWERVCKCNGDLSANIQVFKPMIYTDITDHPILIESKKQLREECKKHGVIAARLM